MPRRLTREGVAAALAALVLATGGLGCGSDPSSAAERSARRPAAGAGRADAAALRSGPDVLRGTWEGVWVEEWSAPDLPPERRLPAALRTTGSVTIDTVDEGRAAGTWTAVDPEAGPDRRARGRFVASVSATGWTLRAGRFTNRGAEVIATARLGPRCPLVEEEAFRGGLGPGADGGLLLSARRRFRCREPESDLTWTVEARWTFFGRRTVPPIGLSPS